MPARRKTISANTALYVGPSPPEAVHTLSSVRSLENVTSWDHDIGQTKEAITVFGALAPADRIALEPPTISMNLSYNSTTLNNEFRLGLVTDGTSGAFSKILNGQADERNIFLARAGEGLDANGVAGAGMDVVGYGNAVISSYSFEAAVGDFPTTTVGFSALNIATYADGVSEIVPSIDSTTGLRHTGTFTLPAYTGSSPTGDAILLPGDITVNFGSLSGVVYALSGACVQGVNFQIDFGRTPIQCLGSKYYTSNTIEGSIPITFSADVFAQDLTVGSLASFLCNQTGGTASVTVRRPNCNQGAGAIAYYFELRNLDWIGENTTISNDGSPQISSFNFEGYLGGGADLTNGIFMSGIYS